MPQAPVFVTLVQAIAMAALMACSLGLIGRWITQAQARHAVMGCLFGLAAVTAMASPIALGDGVIVDMRNLFIGVSAAFFGWIGGGITLGLAVGTRLGIGGDGALPGILAMAMTACMGWLWKWQVSPRLSGELAPGLALGAMISMSLLLMLLMPEPMRSQILLALGPPLLVLYLSGGLLLSFLIRREFRLIEENRALMQAAVTDELTELPNRKSTRQFMADMGRRKPMKPGIAMMYFDVDAFKEINDTYGHMTGDAVLRGVTGRVNACLRGSDHLARHGGDEFVVIQTGLSHQDAIDAAERCRAAVADGPILSRENSVDVTISIGLYWSAAPVPFAQMFENADAALYAAKLAGRNTVRQSPKLAA